MGSGSGKNTSARASKQARRPARDRAPGPRPAGAPDAGLAKDPVGSEPPRPPAILPRPFLLPAILFVATFLAYSNSFRGVFLFDDESAIVENPSIRSFISAFRPPRDITVSGRPIPNLSLWANHALHGLRPAGYHVANLAFHLIGGLALFGVVRRCARGPEGAAFDANADPRADGPAFAVALLWLLHPLQTESVTYVCQRVESIMTMFLFLTGLAVARAAESDARGDRAAGFRWRGAAVACCAAGMASKEVMATAPLAALLLDRAYLSTSWREVATRRGGLHASLWATLAILAAILASAPRGASAGFGMTGYDPVTAPEYLRSQFGVVLHYLRLVVLPWPLVLDYEWPKAPWPEGAARAVLAPAAVVLPLAVGSVVALLRAPRTGYPAFFFFLVLAPTSTFVPIADLAFEHRLNAPLAGALALAVFGARGAIRRATDDPAARRIAGVATLACAASACGALTFVRNADYASEERMYRSILRERPENSRALANLSRVLFDAGRLDEAIEAADRAIAARPDFPVGHLNRGCALAEAGRDAEALGSFLRATELDANYDEAFFNLAVALQKTGRSAEAERAWRRVAELRPADPEPRVALGVLLARRGALAPAVELFREALALRPDDAEARANLDLALSMLHATPRDTTSPATSPPPSEPSSRGAR